METLQAFESAEDTLFDESLEHPAARNAVAAAYYAVSGRLDIRHLWTRGALNLFRVNLWKRRPGSDEQYVYDSRYVEARLTPNGPIVTDCTLRKAG